MKKILLIEDDYDISEIVEMALNTKYLVMVKQNTQLLVEVLEQFTPDVILIDNFIGQRNAEEIIEEIKSAGVKMDVPLILFSAHHNIESIARRIGAVGFLAKPFALQDLHQCISNALKISISQQL